MCFCRFKTSRLSVFIANIVFSFFVTASPIVYPTYVGQAESQQSNQTLSAMSGLSALENSQLSGVTSPVAPVIPGATGTYFNSSRQGLLLPGETSIHELLPVVDIEAAPPYGANIFAGGYETERVDGLNDDYLVAAGDKLQIWLWGAVNYANLATVDNQGNIFIPEVGPIAVGGVSASQVNEIVTAKVKNVYRKNVNVYINLMTATPISVYVTGPVIRPGQYAGMASDSVLYFLKRAGGIDSDRGSYRDIKIIRDNNEVLNVDLYEFIRKGQLTKTSFQDGDVILVGQQGATVNVSGGARNAFRFEFASDMAKGSELAMYARPLARISHVGIVGDREDGPFSMYLPYKDYLNYSLSDGDKVVFNDDLHAQVYDVQVSGSYLGPSYYAIDRKTRLYDLLNHIEIEEELADFKSIYILRQSVAQKQKEMIERSLQRLERSVFTAPVSSDSEATIRAAEAEMVMQFAEKARQVDPLGKVIVSEDGNIANIQLEQGDQVVIPAKTDLVQVGGEVLMPQAVVFNKKALLEDYVAWAGGFTDRADDSRIAVVHANGMIDFSGDAVVQPGDQILVLPKVDVKAMQTVKDITQIVYQIAVAANVILE